VRAYGVYSVLRGNGCVLNPPVSLRKEVMKGQWIGEATGELPGKLIINIDDLGDHYAGYAYLLPYSLADGSRPPGAAAYFETVDKSNKFSFTAYISPIDPDTGQQTEWENIKDRFPIFTFSSQAIVTGYFKENELSMKSKGVNGSEYATTIIREPFSEDSSIEGKELNWDKYKRHVSSMLTDNSLFRGQRQPWKLRTFFHRKKRYDLNRFISKDIQKLHQNLSAKTSHLFNLEVPKENGAFFNLVQHHGYPTPLLDWTLSPYVAAFFAFRRVPKNSTGKSVRIFIFNQNAWEKDFQQLEQLDVPGLHLSISEFLAIANDRLLPQQSVTTVTNVDDIEAYITSREKEKGKKYISAIDIPVLERNKVMQELSFMGITAGSMFPGLDGACEELREKMFDS